MVLFRRGATESEKAVVVVSNGLGASVLLAVWDPRGSNEPADAVEAF